MPDNASIRLMPIHDLLDKQFLIPKYQRGYRWGEQEIRELLYDIYDYAKRADDATRANNDSVQVGNFYCLQPIVVKKNGARHDVIDGQQRLTSIYLLLTYLKKLRIEEYPQYSELYSITFESRQNCAEFLANEQFTICEKSYSNIDLYHMSMCYRHIDEWFTDMAHIGSRGRRLMLETLLESSKNIQVLWYEITNNDDPISIFSRLNIGKIPLTDAELIKALLLQKDCYKEEQKTYIQQQLFEIASAWDAMEVALQDKNLWYFLNDTTYKPSSRIELLFKILAEDWNATFERTEQFKTTSRNFAYLVFDKYLAQKRKEHEADNNPLAAVKAVWEDVQMLYDIIIEWYNDKKIYHYIGFLLSTFKNIHGKYTIKKFRDEYMAKNSTKNIFIASLKKNIAETICCCEERHDNNRTSHTSEENSICGYTYSDHPKLVIDFLLLFNIDAILKLPDEAARFPFGLFKQKNATSIEHIHPQHPANIPKDNEEMRREWLTSAKAYLENIRQDAQSADAKTTDAEEERNTERREAPVPESESRVSALEALQKNVDTVLRKKGFEGFEKLQGDILEFCETLTDSQQKTDFLPNLALLTNETNSSLNNGFFHEKRQRIQLSLDYIPLCTERVFNKYYTKSPGSMHLWNATDRAAYAEAMKRTYAEYIASPVDNAQQVTPEEASNA